MIEDSALLSRFLLDMHIPDWDRDFLSEFDPEVYCELVVSTGAQSVMVYSQSHLGLTYWPSSTGTRHPAATERDLFGETVRRLHDRGLQATAYYSVVFNNDAAQRHPEWAIRAEAPLSFGPLPGPRYGLVCPNNPGYLDFALGQIRELVSRYPIDGLFTDMAFWPTVCLCDFCRERSMTELGRDIPVTVNWDDPDWCGFQRARERWLFEFVNTIRSAARENNPQLPIYHNSAVILGHWARGYSFNMASLSTFLGGDFYAGADEQALVSRLLTLMTESRPAEFMTTMRRHLTDHEELRSPEELEMIALSAIASGAAIRFIDAVDPVGTINAAAYEVLKPIFQTVRRFSNMLGGEPASDVGVYVSDFSLVAWRSSGAVAAESTNPTPSDHMRAALSAVQSLVRTGVPVAVVTRKDLEVLARLRVLVLPNARYLSDEETDAVHEFVRAGGRLYISGTSGYGSELGARPHWPLADLAGCVIHGEIAEQIAYVLPEDHGAREALAPSRLVTLRSAATEARPVPRIASLKAGATVEGIFVFAYAGANSDRLARGGWSSIHSDPPWVFGDDPAIVRNRFGKGEVIYSAGDLECQDGSGSRLFCHLVESLMPDEPLARVHGPAWLSVSMFHQPENHRYVAALLANPSDLPAQPVHNVNCEFCVHGNTVSSIIVAGAELELPMARDGSRVVTTVPVVDKLAVLTISYKPGT